MGIEGVVDQLELLYRELDESLSVNPSVNPCGTCNACCRSEGRVSHGVSELELLYLEVKTGPQAEFRDYLSGREKRTCPHYEAGVGCRVYAARPFSCRVFGHYSEMGSALPPDCTYRGQTRRFRPYERVTALPGAAQLKQLQLELTVSNGRNGQRVERRALPRHESLDRAVELARRGDSEGAVRELQLALEGQESSGYVLYNAGLVYAMLGMAELSLRAFTDALRDLPLSVEARYYAATQALFLGQRDRARELAEEARRLGPGHTANLSLLGSLYRQEGRLEEARACLEGLTGPLERYYLGEVWVGLGEFAQARACFAEAAHHAPLREQAEQALEALSPTL